MLRITICNRSERTCLFVEGKLAGDCVGELEKCWQSALSFEPRGSIIVDLRNVSFIDENGKNLLSRMHDSGTEFITSGLMMKFIVDEIEKNNLKAGI